MRAPAVRITLYGSDAVFAWRYGSHRFERLTDLPDWW